MNFGKLLLVYFMRPPDLEALGVMRPLGACGPGTVCPVPSLAAMIRTSKIEVQATFSKF